MKSNQQKRRGWKILGAVWIVFGFFVLYLSSGDSGFPERSTLVSASGLLLSVSKSRSAVSFSLKGEALQFKHLSKSGKFLPVYQALSGAGGKMVTVLFDPGQGWQPVSSGDAFHTVYEIHLSDQMLLSYEEARQAWLTDQGLGSWFGMACLIAGALMMVFAGKRR